MGRLRDHNLKVTSQMCAIDDAEPFDEYQQENVAAAASAKCDECGRQLRLDEIHRYVRGKYEDEWHEFRSCQHCDAAGVWLVRVCGGYPITMLSEELHEHCDEYPASGVLADLCRAIDNRWNDGKNPMPDKARIREDADMCLASLTVP